MRRHDLLLVTAGAVVDGTVPGTDKHVAVHAVDGTDHGVEFAGRFDGHIRDREGGHSPALSTSKELSVHGADGGNEAEIGGFPGPCTFALLKLVDKSVVATGICDTLLVEAYDTMRGHGELIMNPAVLLRLANSLPELDVLGARRSNSR